MPSRQPARRRRYIMKSGFVSIPFEVEGDNSFMRAKGIAKFSSAGIVFECETSFLGFVKTGFRDLRIPKSEVADIKIIHGFFNSNFEKFFHTRIHIRLHSFEIMSEFPTKNGRIIMKINRRDRDLADLAVAALDDQPPELEGRAQDQLPPAGVRALFGDEADTKELE
jgi:hypothetical protein